MLDISVIENAGHQGVRVPREILEIFIPIAIGNPNAVEGVDAGAGNHLVQQNVSVIALPAVHPGIDIVQVHGAGRRRKQLRFVGIKDANAAIPNRRIGQTVPGGIDIQGIQMHEIDTFSAVQIEVVVGDQLHRVDLVGKQAPVGVLRGVEMQQEREIHPFQIIIRSQAGRGRDQDVGAAFHDLGHAVGRQAQAGVQLLNPQRADDADAVESAAKPETLGHIDVFHVAHIIGGQSVRRGPNFFLFQVLPVLRVGGQAHLHHAAPAGKADVAVVQHHQVVNVAGIGHGLPLCCGKESSASSENKDQQKLLHFFLPCRMIRYAATTVSTNSPNSTRNRIFLDEKEKPMAIRPKSRVTTYTISEIARCERPSESMM